MNTLKPEPECHLCSSPALDPAFRAKGYEIVRCPVCGLVQVASIPDNTPDGTYSDAYFSEETLNGSIDHRASWGKWANLAFITYKLRRIVPALVPGWLDGLFTRRGLNCLAVYVPTQDIQYIAIRLHRGEQN